METTNDAMNGPESLEVLKTRYLGHLQLRNLSPLTVRQENLALRLFIAFLEARGIFSVHAVGHPTIEAYKIAMMAQKTKYGVPLTAATVRGRLLSVQGWFRFLRKKGVLRRDPASEVQAPRCGRRLPAGVMSEAEVRAVLALPDTATALGQRDRTMIEVLYATGARAAELLDLRLPDVNLVKKVVTIRHGKGDKGRLAPLTTSAIGHLVRYLGVTRPVLAQGLRPVGNGWRKKYRTGGDVLFLSSFGARLTNTWLAALLKDYLHRAGITRRMSPVHGFRHALATHLLENGLDVRYVQGVLGHASLETTQLYTRVDKKHLRQQVKKYHPRSTGGGPFRPFTGPRSDARG